MFTVHGTFAHETEWDNWDAKDDERKKEQRAFINRLATHLKERGIDARRAGPHPIQLVGRQQS